MAGKKSTDEQKRAANKAIREREEAAAPPGTNVKVIVHDIDDTGKVKATVLKTRLEGGVPDPRKKK